MLKDERFIAVAFVVLVAAVGGTVGSGIPKCNSCKEYLSAIMRRVNVLRVLRMEQSVKDSISPSELETINFCKNECLQSDKELVASNSIRKKRNVLEDPYQYFYPNYGNKIIGLINYDELDLAKNEAGNEGKYVPFLYDESSNRFMDQQAFGGFGSPNRNWENDYNALKEPLIYAEEEDIYARNDQFLDKIVDRLRSAVMEELRSYFPQVPSYIGYQQNNLVLPVVSPRGGDKMEVPAVSGQGITPGAQSPPTIQEVPVDDRSEGVATAPATSLVPDYQEAAPVNDGPEITTPPPPPPPTTTTTTTAAPSIPDQESEEPIPAAVAVAVDVINDAQTGSSPGEAAVANTTPSGVEPESTTLAVPDESAEDSEAPDAAMPDSEDMPMARAHALTVPQTSVRNEEIAIPTDCSRKLGLKH